MKKPILYAVILLLICPNVLFAQEVPDFGKLLKTLDFRSNFEKTDFSATHTMISEDPEDGVTKNVITIFRRDAEDKFLMLTLEPENIKGQGILRIGDNMFLYDPQSRKFTHSSLKENVNDTDAKNSDFRMSTYAEDYNVTAYSEGNLGKFSVWILDLEANNDSVPYPFKKAWVDKKSSLLLKTEDYSLSRRLLRTSLFPSYAKVGDSYAPSKMIFIDETIEGRKTQITVTDVSIEKLPDSVFTKAYVERVNR
ncbi:MAG: outer membrane lipoprotein-sorting protein [Spirochaetales bacterium]|nr:outer membrane lipoprotein-sorting protein [Spirochaetales bacterium]